MNVPATTRVESETRTPLVTGTVIGAPCEMSLGPEHQRVPNAVGRREGDPQRTGTGHSPDDLELVTDVQWNTTGAEHKAPKLAIGARTVKLVRRAANAGSRRRRADFTPRPRRRGARRTRDRSRGRSCSAPRRRRRAGRTQRDEHGNRRAPRSEPHLGILPAPTADHQPSGPPQLP
jgi:hypothetical protein